MKKLYTYRVTTAPQGVQEYFDGGTCAYDGAEARLLICRYTPADPAEDIIETRYVISTRDLRAFDNHLMSAHKLRMTKQLDQTKHPR